MTTAAEAATQIGNDGQEWVGDDGRDLDTICRDLGAQVLGGEGRYCKKLDCWGSPEDEEVAVDPQWTRYLFDDGSAIVDCGTGWDTEGATPWTWEGL